MSLDNNTKRQLNDIVDAIDGRIEDAIDKREVEAKKQSIFGTSSPVNEFSSTLNKEWNGIQDVFNKKSLEHNIEFKSMKISDQTGDVVGLDNGGLKDIQRGYFDITTVMPQLGLSNDSGEYRYIVNSSETNNFDAVAEGADSAESSLSFTEKSVRPENIRSYLLASREISDDVAQFSSFVSTRGYQMLIDQVNGQILNGNGTAPNLSGLTLSANRTSYDYTASNPYYQSVSSPQEIDALLSAINVLLIDGFSASVILVNPKQFGKFSFLKSSQNEYLKNDNFRITGSNSAVINGVPIYATNKMADDQFYVADANKAFALVRKGGLNLRVTSEGQDLFKKNLVMMELSARIANLVTNPNAVIYGDFSEAITALTSS
jgi:HK97 family phage major capsid protein